MKMQVTESADGKKVLLRLPTGWGKDSYIYLELESDSDGKPPCDADALRRVLDRIAPGCVEMPSKCNCGPDAYCSACYAAPPAPPSSFAAQQCRLNAVVTNGVLTGLVCGPFPNPPHKTNRQMLDDHEKRIMELECALSGKPIADNKYRLALIDNGKSAAGPKTSKSVCDILTKHGNAVSQLKDELAEMHKRVEALDKRVPATTEPSKLPCLGCDGRGHGLAMQGVCRSCKGTGEVLNQNKLNTLARQIADHQADTVGVGTAGVLHAIETNDLIKQYRAAKEGK